MRRLAVVSVLFAAACGGAPADKEPLGAPKTLHVQSTAFDDGAAIPEKYTGDGDDASPPLSWTAGPAGTKCYALVMHDPDAPEETFTHWVVWNFVGTSLPENVTPYTKLGEGVMQGRNMFDRSGYGGPSPPSGNHHYVFRVYALDAPLELLTDAEEPALVAAMRGHALAYGELIGRYAAKTKKK